jgi:hypothetical protein
MIALVRAQESGLMTKDMLEVLTEVVQEETDPSVEPFMQFDFHAPNPLVEGLLTNPIDRTNRVVKSFIGQLQILGNNVYELRPRK